MRNKLRWALGGGKPQAITILKKAITLSKPPEFIIPSPDLPQDDLKQLSAVAGQYAITLIPFSKMTREHLCSLDLFLTCRFPILSHALFTAPRLGAVNFHNSLLPQYRGTHPVSWALINDEKETGVTLHRIDEHIDTGPILYQIPFTISDHMNLWELTQQLDIITGKLVETLFTYLDLHGELPEMQVQEGKKSKAPRRHPQDSRINFSLTARQIVKLIKALPSPLPQAFCFLDKNPVFFSDAELADNFFTECHTVGTVQAKIYPNIYIVKAQNAFVKLYCNDNIPIGAVLE